MRASEPSTVVALVCAVALAMAHSSSTAQAQGASSDYLRVHNEARSQVGVPPVQWSTTVANYASRRAALCDFKHAPGPYGENLYWGTVDKDATDAVELWVSEKANYDCESNSCAVGKVCGHYTQVVWQNTKRIGCASKVCGSLSYFVCNYDPPGNFAGQSPYPCTQSSEELSSNVWYAK